MNNKEIIEILTNYGRFHKEDTEAVTATKSRDAKIDELDDFYSDLLTVAKVAFIGREEMLNQLC